MTVMTTYADNFDMSQWNILTDFAGGDFGFESANIFTLFSATQKYVFTGSGFAYDSNGVPTDGAITHIKVVDQSGGADNVQVTGLNLTVQQLETFALTNDVTGLESTIFSGNDTFNVGNSDFHNSNAVIHLQGFDGNDTFNFGENFNSSDTVDGGTGHNTISFAYAPDIITPGMFQNIQKIVITGGTSFNVLEVDDPNMSGGKTLILDAHALSSSEAMQIYAYSEPTYIIGGAGNDTIFGGTNNDHITGGLGSDTLSGLGGNNTFIYHSAAESTGMSIDAITDFVASKDHFQMPKSVNAIDTPITTGTLDYGANFDTELQAAVKGHLDAGDAILFAPDSGNMAGFTLLVVDENGHAGYQPGHDIVIQLGGPHTDLMGFSTANFIV